MNTEHEDRILHAIQSNQFDQARIFISDAFNNECELTKLLMYIGFICEKNNQVAKAMRHYRAALDIDGTNDVALYNLYRLGDVSNEPIRYR